MEKQKDKKHIVIVIMGNIIGFNVHKANKHDTN